uniref:Uncharacterized protein n=1 Tax=Arundo donax TaxID=35708 RepID=A0A0A9DMH6_ARUDO
MWLFTVSLTTTQNISTL